MATCLLSLMLNIKQWQFGPISTNWITFCTLLFGVNRPNLEEKGLEKLLFSERKVIHCCHNSISITCTICAIEGHMNNILHDHSTSQSHPYNRLGENTQRFGFPLENSALFRHNLEQFSVLDVSIIINKFINTKKNKIEKKLPRSCTCYVSSYVRHNCNLFAF